MAADPLLEDYNRLISSHSLSAYAPATLDEDTLLEHVEKMTAAVPEETPMFKLQPLRFRPASPIVHMAAANNKTVCALKNGKVVYTNLESPHTDQEEFHVDRAVSKVHLDPTGTHLLISHGNKETSYMCLDWTPPRTLRPLGKCKGVAIETIAWDSHAPRGSTGEMLVGTSENKLYQCVLDVREGKVDVRVWKVAYSFPALTGETVDEKITGIHYERFPNEPTKAFVIITSTYRIFRFVGRATTSIAELFLLYNSDVQPRMSDMGSLGRLKQSRLCVSQSETGRGNFMSWLCPVGIFSATIAAAGQNVGDDVIGDDQVILLNEEMAAASALSRGEPAPAADDEVEPPTDIFLTNFHWLVLWDGKLQAISKLDKQNVCEEYIPGYPARTGQVLGFCHDVRANLIWICCEMSLFLLSVDREDRHIWKQYLRRALETNSSTLSHDQKVQYFEEAYRYAYEPHQKDEVSVARGDFYFASGQYNLAATFFGRTNRSFEDIVLKFQRAEQDDALRKYLTIKLSCTERRQMSQRTLLSTWLVQLYLDKLTALRDARQLEQYRQMQEEFRAFLRDYRLDLSTKTVLDLISSHGQIEELLFFAAEVGDYERVIAYWLQQPAPTPPPGQSPLDAWKYSRQPAIQAIAILKKLPDNVELVQRFAPTLMQQVPHKTVKLWISCVALDPRRLIPAMMRYSLACNPPKPGVQDVNQATRYLRFCVDVRKNKEPAIHNFLLSLYAKEPSEEPLLRFLDEKRTAKLDGDDTCYDENYALRLCLQHNKIRACVLIYEMKFLYEEAVELALQVDIDLAKKVASAPHDEELQKKLFIMVARHILAVDNDSNKVTKAVDLLNHCKFLKIEDILPYFEDFTRIDRFKGLLNSSLDHYDKDIKFLLQQMANETQNANLLRDAIQQTRNRFGYVSEAQVCDLCGVIALSREFYVFSCQHVFHAACLEREASKHLDIVDLTRFRQAKQRLAPLEEKLDHGQLSELDKSQYDQLLEELEDLIAAECLYCGRAMIEAIDQPFISASDATELRTWML